MEAYRSLRIMKLENQIWLLKLRTEAMRNELPSNPAGSQNRIDAEKDLAALRAQIKGLVRERERLEIRR